MNSKLIRDQAIILAGISIDAVYSRRWQNEAMQLLADMYDSARVFNTTTVTVTDPYSNQTLPTGCFGVTKVRYADGTTYKRYTVNRSYMRFYDSGTFTVEYLKAPADISGDTATPEIDERFHKVIPYWEAAQELSRINASNPKIQELKAQFYRFADVANAAIKSQKRNDITIARRIFR